MSNPFVFLFLLFSLGCKTKGDNYQLFHKHRLDTEMIARETTRQQNAGLSILIPLSDLLCFSEITTRKISSIVSSLPKGFKGVGDEREKTGKINNS